MPTIRELREKACLTQEEVAHKAGVSVFTICRIERTHSKPRARNVRKLAEVFGVRIEEIEWDGKHE